MSDIYEQRSFDILSEELFEYTVFTSGMAEVKVFDSMTGDLIWGAETKHNWGIDLALSWCLGQMSSRYEGWFELPLKN